ncbi:MULTISPECIES: DUF1173 domain-containing protein [unclassified Ensifer]|uniref:DUF1173 domain-containing protein n=1 Tax=unclassified Ensifer TaxID=2633371 RepID=UPI0008136AC2|nr:MULTISPECIES: DUF1173 domain-containing protein [unclassified Ensifer]OCP22447.1 hypothetical protein BC361_24655 [Ensifer sp. LC54]OCP22657.1 hypothetical protein BC363_26790 [Ensifer sp. LC384]
MRNFTIGDQTLAESSPEFRALLPHAYEQRLRPMCLCKEPPVPMYIARLEDQYLIKRMPLSGRDHDPACSSYEPPYELSGLGPLIGNAIQIDASGKAELKLDFSLTKRGPRSAPGAPAEAAEPAVRSEPKKLSLRAMLHYLWEAGELTEWRSTWAGRRGWGRVRTSLINAALQMTARGGPLSDMLFIPEVFHSEDKDGIAARRATALKNIQATGSGPRKLMMIVAEVKEFSAAREGHRIVVRHMPFPLMVEDGAWRRLAARYEIELELWRSSETFHLIVIATFGISAAGIASVEEVALMVVNEHWLPFEDIHELRLLEKLSHLKRKSVKGLRFNLRRDAPIVSVTLPEQKPAPVAMFIVPASAGDDYEHALADMIAARPEIASWIWRVAEGEMPRLP